MCLWFCLSCICVCTARQHMNYSAVSVCLRTIFNDISKRFRKLHNYYLHYQNEKFCYTKLKQERTSEKIHKKCYRKEPYFSLSLSFSYYMLMSFRRYKFASSKEKRLYNKNCTRIMDNKLDCFPGIFSLSLSLILVTLVVCVLCFFGPCTGSQMCISMRSLANWAWETFLFRSFALLTLAQLASNGNDEQYHRKTIFPAQVYANAKKNTNLISLLVCVSVPEFYHVCNAWKN